MTSLWSLSADPSSHLGVPGQLVPLPSHLPWILAHHHHRPRDGRHGEYPLSVPSSAHYLQFTRIFPEHLRLWLLDILDGTPPDSVLHSLQGLSFQNVSLFCYSSPSISNPCILSLFPHSIHKTLFKTLSDDVMEMELRNEDPDKIILAATKKKYETSLLVPHLLFIFPSFLQWVLVY